MNFWFLSLCIWGVTAKTLFNRNEVVKWMSVPKSVIPCSEPVELCISSREQVHIHFKTLLCEETPWSKAYPFSSSRDFWQTFSWPILLPMACSDLLLRTLCQGMLIFLLLIKSRSWECDIHEVTDLPLNISNFLFSIFKGRREYTDPRAG